MEHIDRIALLLPTQANIKYKDLLFNHPVYRKTALIKCLTELHKIDGTTKLNAIIYNRATMPQSTFNAEGLAREFVM